MFGWIFNRKSPKSDLPEQLKSIVDTRLTARRKMPEGRFQQLWAQVLCPQTQNVILSVDELEQLLDTIVAHEIENGYAYPDCTASTGLFRYIMVDQEEQMTDLNASTETKPHPDEMRQILDALSKKVKT